MATDTILRVFGGPTDNGSSVDLQSETIGYEATDYDDAVKFTNHLQNFTGLFGTIISGRENCIDINNKVNGLNVTAKELVANHGLYPITIKGGSTNCVLNGTFVGRGKECEVDAGNWSDQSNDYVKNWSVNLKMWDGSPVKIRCLQADRPTEVSGSGPYIYAFPHPDKWYHNIVTSVIMLGIRISKLF